MLSGAEPHTVEAECDSEADRPNVQAGVEGGAPLTRKPLELAPQHPISKESTRYAAAQANLALR